MDIAEAVRRSLFDQIVDDIRREYADWMEIGAIAIIFVGFKRDAERLRHERVVTYCDRAEPVDGSDIASGLLPEAPQQEQPCWKGRDDNGRGDLDLIVAPDRWCDGCKRRQRIHDEYRAVVKQRGIAMRKLMRRIDKFAKTFPELPTRMSRVHSGGSMADQDEQKNETTTDQGGVAETELNDQQPSDQADGATEEPKGEETDGAPV